MPQLLQLMRAVCGCHTVVWGPWREGVPNSGFDECGRLKVSGMGDLEKAVVGEGRVSSSCLGEWLPTCCYLTQAVSSPAAPHSTSRVL